MISSGGRSQPGVLERSLELLPGQRVSVRPGTG
jgi:hypothetical protein